MASKRSLSEVDPISIRVSVMAEKNVNGEFVLVPISQAPRCSILGTIASKLSRVSLSTSKRNTDVQLTPETPNRVSCVPSLALTIEPSLKVKVMESLGTKDLYLNIIKKLEAAIEKKKEENLKKSEGGNIDEEKSLSSFESMQSRRNCGGSENVQFAEDQGVKSLETVEQSTSLMSYEEANQASSSPSKSKMELLPRWSLDSTEHTECTSCLIPASDKNRSSSRLMKEINLANERKYPHKEEGEEKEATSCPTVSIRVKLLPKNRLFIEERAEREREILSDCRLDACKTEDNCELQDNRERITQDPSLEEVPKQRSMHIPLSKRSQGENSEASPRSAFIHPPQILSTENVCDSLESIDVGPEVKASDDRLVIHDASPEYLGTSYLLPEAQETGWPSNHLNPESDDDCQPTTSDSSRVVVDQSLGLISDRYDDLNNSSESDCSEEEARSEHTEMNYFRNKFHRKSYLNSESVLRDVRKRRSLYEDKGSREIPSSNSSSPASTLSNHRLTLKKSTDKPVSTSIPIQLYNPTKNSSKLGLSTKDEDNDRPLEPSISSKGKSVANNEGLLRSPLNEKSERASLSKTPSLRRRRWPSDENGQGKYPSKKGNYENESTSLEEVAHKTVESRTEIPSAPAEDMEDPLGFIEIKSAAQWKAMSKRITWKFDESRENANANTHATTDHCLEVSNEKNEHKPANIRNSISFTINPKLTPSAETIVDFKPTKVQQLRLVCWKVKPWNQVKKNPKLFTSQFAAPWGADCDEVYPGLLIGDKHSASNVRFLQKIGVTHVLNTAEGKDEGLVDLCQSHYEGTTIKYLGFPLWDTPTCNIIPYMGCASEFIASAIQGGGKCLVNCQMGVSRSSSCAMAYLLIDQEMKAVDVMTQFRMHRDIRPNDGFLEQIVDLDNDLRKFREHGIPRSITLSTLSDLALLPQSWHYEFWTSLVTEEEIGHPLVHLGEPCPIKYQISSGASKSSSKATSRRTSGRVSKRSSFKSSKSSPKCISRNGSFRSGRSSRGRSVNRSIRNQEDESLIDDGGEWEWVWEDDEEDLENIAPTTDTEILPIQDKLLKVKEIIERPEERWRVMCNTTKTCETPSSVCSCQSIASNLSVRSVNVVQPGLDENDPLSIVKINSAKQWKAISKNLTIDLQGIDISDKETHGKSSKDLFEFVPTTAQQLRIICWRIKPWEQPKTRNLFSAIFGASWGVDCDEVFPNLFIGDEATARNIKFLQKMKITHVLNTAEGVWTDYSFVDLNAKYFEGSGITYQGLQIWDSTHAKILPFLGCANEFIKSAISTGGKCLVHCQMGVSRSCVSAMAYMMLTKTWEAVDVMREFRKRRDVRPNDSFLEQIVELDNELRKERLFNVPRSIQLHPLKDLHLVPKPWHFEFWDAPPDKATLPFKLTHFGEPRPDMYRKRQVSEKLDEVPNDKLPEVALHSAGVESQEKAVLSTTEVVQENTNHDENADGSSSEWEWEDDHEEEEEEEEEIKRPKGDRIIPETTQTKSQLKDVPKITLPPFMSGAPKQTTQTYNIVKQPPIESSKSASRRDSGEFVPTTDKQLRLICWRVKPWSEKKTSKLFSSQFAVAWKVDCDEVFPNLFIGDGAAASNIKFLKHLNITHVLNTAQGDDEGLVNLESQHFQGSGITYKGFLMWDSAWFDVSPFLDEAADFIAEALESGGKCLVNCQMGVSRSCTCAMAFMMKKNDWSATDVLKQFRSHRDVRPNDGFMRTLANLDNKLRKQREGFL